MDERQLRTAVTAVIAVLLGLVVLLAAWHAWGAGTMLRERRWGWVVPDLVFAGLWVRLAVKWMRGINEHGLLGRSPWPRDQDEEEKT